MLFGDNIVTSNTDAVGKDICKCKFCDWPSKSIIKAGDFYFLAQQEQCDKLNQFKW